MLLFKLYIKRAFKKLLLGKVYSLLNLFSLTLGLTCSILVLEFVNSELGYNKCHKKRDSIFRMTFSHQELGTSDSRSSLFLYEEVNNKIPEVESTFLIGRCKSLLGYKNSELESQGIGTTSEIFSILTIDFISGSAEAFNTNTHNNIVISRTLKDKLLGSTPAEGTIVYLVVNARKEAFQIVGVFNDLPRKSSIQADFFIHFDHISETQKVYLAEQYVQIHKNQNRIVEKKLNDIIVELNVPQKIVLQPLNDIHFKSSHLLNNQTPEGNFKNLIFYILIGFTILSCSIINYATLGSSRTLDSKKEIIVHKIFGANSFNIVLLTLSETTLLAIIALPLAFMLSEVFLPYANFLFGKDLEINLMKNLSFTIWMIGITFFTGILSGILTAINCIKTLPVEGLVKSLQKKNHLTIQEVLLCFQVAVLIGLIFASLIINRQLSFWSNFELGFQNMNTLAVSTRGNLNHNQYSKFIDEVRKIPEFNESAFGSMIPSVGSNMGSYYPKSSSDSSIPYNFIFASPNYLELYNIKVISGRAFDEDINEEGHIIINETAAFQFGIVDNPIGSEIDGHLVIGVVSDFNLYSLHQKTPPLVIYSNSNQRIESFLISFNAQLNKELSNKVELIWRSIFPDIPIRITSVEDTFNAFYKEEIKLKKTTSIFAILSIIISSFGVFGLTHFKAKKRSKEIGIRKIVGASVFEIIYLMHKQSLKIFFFSTLFSILITFIIIKNWLSKFEYSVSIELWSIFLSAIVALIVYSLPIFINSYLASTANPVDSIKYE